MNCLAELGTQLLIGGSFNAIYTWDRINTNRGQALLISDSGIYYMITINTNTYIFAGKRGRIYVTNGSQAQLYAKVPDHISGSIDPLFTWGNCAYNKNQLYFGVSARANAGQATITSYAGLWAIDITTNALRAVVLPTTTTAAVTAVYALNNQAVSGYGLYFGWSTGSTYGMNGLLSSTPYTSYTAYVESDLIPIGQYLDKRTFENIEFKLAIPLVANEGIKISVRPYRSGSWTEVGETTTAGAISDYYLVNFDQYQWLQVRVDIKSASSSPSYVRLMQIRIR